MFLSGLLSLPEKAGNKTMNINEMNSVKTLLCCHQYIFTLFFKPNEAVLDTN